MGMSWAEGWEIPTFAAKNAAKMGHPAAAERIADDRTSAQASTFLQRAPVPQVSRYVNGPSFGRLHLNEPDLIRSSVAAIKGLFRDFAGLGLVRFPAAAYSTAVAGAIQGVFLQRALDGGNEVRPVAIGSAGNEVASMASRTFHAMANALHERPDGSGCPRLDSHWKWSAAIPT